MKNNEAHWHHHTENGRATSEINREASEIAALNASIEKCRLEMQQMIVKWSADGTKSDPQLFKNIAVVVDRFYEERPGELESKRDFLEEFIEYAGTLLNRKFTPQENVAIVEEHIELRVNHPFTEEELKDIHESSTVMAKKVELMVEGAKARFKKQFKRDATKEEEEEIRDYALKEFISGIMEGE